MCVVFGTEISSRETGLSNTATFLTTICLQTDRLARFGAKIANFAASIAETRKKKKYSHVIDDHTKLVALAVEATGRMGKDLVTFLKDQDDQDREYKSKFQRMATVVTQ